MDNLKTVLLALCAMFIGIVICAVFFPEAPMFIKIVIIFVVVIILAVLVYHKDW